MQKNCKILLTLFLFVLLGIELKAYYMLGKFSTTDQYPPPLTGEF